MKQLTFEEYIKFLDFTDRVNALFNEAAIEDASTHINDIAGEYMAINPTEPTKTDKTINRIDTILNNYTKRLVTDSKDNIARPEVIQTLLALAQLRTQLGA